MKKNKGIRTDIFKLIPRNAKRILDVGCGDGALAKRIKESYNIEVIGIEKDETAYKKAISNIDNVILGDIENLRLPFEKDYFDCIITADILEHLRDPLRILQELKIFLKKDGYFIASIPNIRYYKILLRLLRGYWDYSEAGILDNGHLRFFTLVSIKEMFEEAGYRILDIKRNIVSARGFKVLNFLLFNCLKEFLVYQYYIVAKESDESKLNVKKRVIPKF